MKRKFITVIFSLAIIAGLLAGCASAPTAAQIPAAATTQPVTESTSAPAATESTSSTNSTRLDTSYENAVSVEMQLVLGTLKLESTDQAVTQSEATALIPLWTQVQSLTQSMMPTQGNAMQSQSTNSDAQTQVNKLLDQIQAAMTSDQISAIAALKLTNDSVMTLMKDLNISMGGPNTNANSTNNGTPSQGAPQGQPPANGNGDQGQPPSNGNGGAGQPPQGGTPLANGQGGPNGMNGNAGNFVPPELIEALIKALNTKAGTSSTDHTATLATNNNAGNNPPPGNGGSSADTGLTTATGTYTLNGGTATESGKTYNASNTDQSGVYVLGAGKLTMTNATIITTGNTSSNDNSSFYGLNAGVLAAYASAVNMADSTISTSGTGANGAFATGDNSSVALTNVTINATGDGAHGVMATQGATATLNNVNITTSGENAAPLATDRGGGTINATSGTVKSSGQDSPCYYSTGTITVSDNTCTSSGAEIAVIEGANSINLTNTTASSSVANKWGVMLYQSFSGDAQGTEGSFTMSGGSLVYTAASGPLFYVTNATGTIALSGVNTNVASGILLQAAANSRWGTSGSNGGNAILNADNQTLIGDLIADNLSTITTALKNGSVLKGSINSDNSAKSVTLTLDSTSNWNVTADSYLTCLNDTGGISGTTIMNITGNGRTVYYNANACPALNGQTYSLVGSGSLTPIK